MDVLKNDPPAPAVEPTTGRIRKSMAGALWRESRPILLAVAPVNQMFPSGPVVIPTGRLPGVGIGNSVMTPSGGIRPILLPSSSVNQRFPSGPAVMPRGL